MNFYKTSFLSGLYSVVNLITGLVITKVSASLIGPIGTAYIGKFANITGLILIFSTASIATGIVKYVAQYKNNETELKKIINTAFGIILIGSVLGMIVVFTSYKFLNIAAFNNQNFENVFLLYGIFLLFISLQIIITSVLNGIGEIRMLSYVNISAALLNLVITTYSIYNFHIAGALFSNSIFGILTTVTGLFAFKKLNMLNTQYFNPKIDLPLAFQLIKYGVFAAITSFSWMWTMIFIRENIEHQLTTKDAGLWQAMFSLSDRYLTVITNIMIVYFIPKLSELSETQDLVTEIRKAFKRIVPIMIILSGSIWLCKDIIISLLLAESFRPMRELFSFQMIGDVFRITASILSYLIASKAMFRSGLKADLTFHLSLLLGSYFLVNQFGLVGASYAYAIATFLYLLINLFIFKDLMVLVKKSVLPKPWLK
ncbi:MAG: O-antigen translocase [Saprospiraceae bacterium]|nr:O-antigen translocase [Saprospiraceae bacterium]